MSCVYCFEKKYICIPPSFIVINVRNQGKTLCSPCISLQNKTYIYIYRNIAYFLHSENQTFCNSSAQSTRLYKSNLPASGSNWRMFTHLLV